MEQQLLEAKLRTKKGKVYSRKLRKEGLIPAVLYGGSKDPLPVEVNIRDLERIFLSGEGSNIIINLQFSNVNGNPVEAVLIKDFQQDPVTSAFLHVDFLRVSLKEKITAHVPLVLVGEAPGVKETGILEHFLRELTIRCLPLEIPRHIEVDVSQLKIGESIHARDLKVPKGIEVLSDPDQVVVTIGVPSKLEVEEVVAAPTVTEPEVIGKGKEEEVVKEEEKEAEK